MVNPIKVTCSIRRKHGVLSEWRLLGRYQCFVGSVKQPVLEEEGRAVREKTIAFHLSEADATAATTTLDRLFRHLKKVVEKV